MEFYQCYQSYTAHYMPFFFPPKEGYACIRWLGGPSQPWTHFPCFMLISKVIKRAGLHHGAFCTKLTSLCNSSYFSIIFPPLIHSQPHSQPMPSCDFVLFQDLAIGLPFEKQSHRVSFWHSPTECCPLSRMVRVSATKK